MYINRIKVIITVIFSMCCYDSVAAIDITGEFMASFPYPYRILVQNENELELEWTEIGIEYKAWEISKKYKYSISKKSVFYELYLDENVPLYLRKPMTGNENPWNVGNRLLGLFGVIHPDSNLSNKRVIGVTYSTTRFMDSNVFTVNVPYYVFDGPAHISPISVSAPSSELTEDNIVHKLINLYSVDSGESWAEGVFGNGIGESFIIDFTVTPQYLVLINGFISAENPQLYYNNGRLKKVRIEGITKGVEFECDIEDTPNLQTIDIRALGNETQAKLTIIDVYPGEKYMDTCLHFLNHSDFPILPLE